MFVKARVFNGYDGFLQERGNPVNRDPVPFVRQNSPGELPLVIENLD